jgi:hypothetical protein
MRTPPIMARREDRRRRIVANAARPQERTILGMLETEPARPAAPPRAAAAGWSLGGPDEIWEPRPLARAVRSGRRFRWTVLVVTALLAAGAYAGMLAGLDALERHTEARRAGYLSAAAGMGAALDDARSAGRVLTDPGTAPDDIATAAAPLVRLGSAAVAADQAAARRLADLPRWFPAPRLDDLTAARSRLREAASLAAGASATLQRVADYRAGVAEILAFPALPGAGDSLPYAEAATILSDYLGAAVTRLGALPDDPALRDHRDSLSGLLDRLGEWKARYLAVLQAGDVAGAGRLVREAHGWIGDVRLASIEPLREAGREADDTLAGVGVRIADVAVLAGS